eukprot:jgi/Chrpa1/2925/Chrysochromulina_OHIO_Genome00012765-RA
MSMSSSSTTGLGGGLRCASSSRSRARRLAVATPSSCLQLKKTTCAVRLSPEPEERAVRTTLEAAAEASPQCSSTRSMTCWSLSTSHTPSHARTKKRSSASSGTTEVSGWLDRIGRSGLALSSGSPRVREHERYVCDSPSRKPARASTARAAPAAEVHRQMPATWKTPPPA